MCATDNPCAEAACAPATGCFESPKAGPCDDDNECTGPDVCSGTACVGAPLTSVCEDGDLCTVDDACSGGVCAGGPQASCDDGVSCTSIDATCRAFFAVDDARIVDGQLSAGGLGTTVTIALPFQGSVRAFTLANARHEATVTLCADMGTVVMVDALVGGAAPKDLLIAAIAALDASVLPLPPAQLATVLNGAIDNDIDLDGAGGPGRRQRRTPHPHEPRDPQVAPRSAAACQRSSSRYGTIANTGSWARSP